MSKLEKLVYVGCPFVFSMVLVVCGWLIIRNNPEKLLYGFLAICTGLICGSIYCACSILVKIVENKKKD